jgi:hypothetical protein
VKWTNSLVFTGRSLVPVSIFSFVADSARTSPIKKGRHGLEGFLFGLFLGPIGVAAVRTLPTLERLPSPPPASASGADH